jgi:hypothetical protein
MLRNFCHPGQVGRWTLVIVTIMVSTVGLASAQVPTSLQVGSKTVTCTSGGLPVTWVANKFLGDVGFTSTAPPYTIIQYNPTVLFTMSDHVQLFWLGHECGHAFQQTTDEMAADCWSAKTGVNQGWFGLSDFAELEQDMQNNFGDSTHPPGPVRTAHVRQCMMQAGSDHAEVEPNPIHVSPHVIPDFDPEANKCVIYDEVHSTITWHLPSRDEVSYRFPYENSCDKPVTCSIKIATGNRPRGSTDWSVWHSFKNRIQKLRISPNDYAAVEGSLEWDIDVPKNEKPAIRNSNSDETGDFGIFCKFLVP